jgi:predicted molibdopterin-dependent oxidoreductase YjgC
VPGRGSGGLADRRRHGEGARREWPEYRTPEDAWNEFADLAPLWTGIRYDRIEEVGLQWPCTDREHPGTPFLHAPSPSRPSGKGKFYPVEYQPPIEQPDSEYPFVLSTGRTLYHYNSATMTMREEGVVQKQEDPFVEMHPDDAARSGSRTATGFGSFPAAVSSRLGRQSASASTPGSSGWRSISRRRR